MAKFSHTDSRRMYSWWWDSHISPKNSKWLQENLTDMDAKVKVMIKLIEEDADSFARRAEMYYKKRPELMRMVEEFYRAYRALAERYDHATGVIRHAHTTMAEAFPNQVPSMFADDSPASLGTDPRTPETARTTSDIDMSNVGPELFSSNSNAANLNGEFTSDSGTLARRGAFKQLKDSFGSVDKVRKGLNFDETENKEGASHGNFSKPGQIRESGEILMLKEAISKLESDKEVGLVQYQQSLDKLSQLESEISQTREDFRVFRDRATKAETETITLKELLLKLETEKNSKLQEYQQCLGRLSDLETTVSSSQEEARKLNQRVAATETEAQSCKVERDKLAVEKDAALNQYLQSLEMIANLENKLRLTEDDATGLKERAENAEREVEVLTQTISKLNDEKEAAALQYQECLEMICSLEQKLSCAQEETKLLNVAVDDGLSKLKGAEEQCLLLERANKSLRSELESLMLKMGTQTHELTEKQKELGQLWARIQEERLRFVEAETAFQTLQHLHTQTQEELQSMAYELQKRSQLLNVSQTHSQSLQDEILKVKEENKHLDQLYSSSSLSMKDMQNEISSLKGSKVKLEEEVELRLDQRNALQQEIYCLKEELNDMNRKHLLVLDQVHLVGFNSESFGSSVRELQVENSNLKEACNIEKGQKTALLEKLENFEQLLEKNSVLETTLSDLNAELDAVRGKIQSLEQSLQSLLKEKFTLLDDKVSLMAQIQETNKNLENLTEDNTVLVNSLSDAQGQLEDLKVTSKLLEDSYQLLENEKAGLINEKYSLTSQLENTQIRMGELGKIYGELEGRCITLEKERDSNLRKAEELQMSLDVERLEHASYIQISDSQFKGVEASRQLLHEECQRTKSELDKVLHGAVNYEIEIFVLRRIAQDLEQNNFVLLLKNQKLLEESSLSRNIISQLEKNNSEQHVEIKSLSEQASSLMAGTYQIMEVAGIIRDSEFMDKYEQHQVYLNQLLSTLRDIKLLLCEAEEENQQWAVELSVLITWIRQLRLQAQNLQDEKNNIEHEFKERNEQLLEVQSELLKNLEINEELRLKLRGGECNNESLMIQIEGLQRNVMDMQDTCTILQKEKTEVYEEKGSLMDKFLLLEEKNQVLKEENHNLCGKVLALDNLSLIFRNCAKERLLAVQELDGDLNKLHDVNGVLMEKLNFEMGMYEESKLEILHLEKQLQNSDDELKVVAAVKDQLTGDSEKGKNLLHQMKLELQEAEQKINLIQTEKLELQKIVEDLKMESNEIKIIRDDQENQILQLSTNNDNLRSETNCLREASQILEAKFDGLQEEHIKSKSLGENLKSDLKRKNNEIDDLEVLGASVFGQLQYSMFSQLLFGQKFNELQEACLGYIDQNEDLKNQLTAFGPEIVSLKEHVASLENHTDLRMNLQIPETGELQGAEVTNSMHANKLNQDEKDLMPSMLSDLRDLHTRLQAIEKALIAVKELMVQENIDLHSKLDDSTRQVDLLKSGNGRHRTSLNQASEISEADNALLTKDIMLDQISNGSPYGLSRREHNAVDNHSVELWETADPDVTDVGKTEKMLSPSIFNDNDLYSVQSMKKGEVPASDELIEKQLSVDKLEISERFIETIQEGNKKKVLERLDSDVQKLANLQITVQDMKRKLQVTEKGKRGKAVVIECETLRGQLEEADTAVMKLFDFNGRLTKTVENSAFSGVKSSFDLEGDGNARKRVSDQARRMSEKIGRLQLEVQKLQFILLKLEDKREGKSTMSETKRRILLRDYLYGGRRTGLGKKAQFCGCVQPSTSDD